MPPDFLAHTVPLTVPARRASQPTYSASEVPHTVPDASELNPQNVAKAAWALATVTYRDEKVFAALATAAKRWLSEFNPQDAANNGMGICNRELPP